MAILKPIGSPTFMGDNIKPIGGFARLDDNRIIFNTVKNNVSRMGNTLTSYSEINPAFSGQLSNEAYYYNTENNAVGKIREETFSPNPLNRLFLVSDSYDAFLSNTITSGQGTFAMYEDKTYTVSVSDRYPIGICKVRYTVESTEYTAICYVSIAYNRRWYIQALVYRPDNDTWTSDSVSIEVTDSMVRGPAGFCSGQNVYCFNGRGVYVFPIWYTGTAFKFNVGRYINIKEALKTINAEDLRYSPSPFSWEETSITKNHNSGCLLDNGVCFFNLYKRSELVSNNYMGSNSYMLTIRYSEHLKDYYVELQRLFFDSDFNPKSGKFPTCLFIQNPYYDNGIIYIDPIMSLAANPVKNYNATGEFKCDSISNYYIDTCTDLNEDTSFQMFGIEIAPMEDYFEYDPNENAGGSTAGAGASTGSGVPSGIVGGSGVGSFNNTSSEIVTPIVPTSIGSADGLYTLYMPNSEQMRSFSSVLYSQNFWDAIKNIVTKPIDSVVSMHYINVDRTALLTGTKPITVGIADTGVTSWYTDKQYISIDCGSISVKEYWGSALDYAPYTKVQIYLPYIGVETLSTDDIMNSTLNVKYNIDLLTGDCIAHISVKKGNLNSVLYSFTGNCAVYCPLTSLDYSQFVQSAATMASATVATIASAGTAGATGANGVLSATAATSAINSGLNTVTHIKGAIQRSGKISGNTGVMSTQKPYLIITRPIQSLPENYASYRGYPCNVTKRLSELTGYTEVGEIHLTGLSATQTEQDEIETLLKNGVIF